MVRRNPYFSHLSENYLFPEVQKRAAAYPEALSLSIGNTSEPIPEEITSAIADTARRLSTPEGYQGYGPEQGDLALRQELGIDPDEIFISDGAKCDIGRLQILFGSDVTIAVQNPTYPVYVDTGLLMGQTVLYLDCTPENNFFPTEFPSADIYYICSPNNPTGAVATHEQLQAVVDAAQEHKALIVFDAAYSAFIQDPTLPKSIYEIAGADEVAIEVNSFSKSVGFTGVRLGWTIVPKKLTYTDGRSVWADYKRIVTTFFNGPSILSQAGGKAALFSSYTAERLTAHYMKNATYLRAALQPKGFPLYGGENAPYLWMHIPHFTSWEIFDQLIANTGIITTPGSGFGTCGEEFVRFSAFGTRKHIINACKRIETQWPESLSLLPT